MAEPKDLTGEIFGRLRVLWKAPVTDDKKGRWTCICSCGKQVDILTGNLTRGNTKSCGCYKRESVKTSAKTHGMSSSNEYSHWGDIKKRCTNPNSQDYKYYSLMQHSQEILDKFVNFYEEIGPIPDAKQRFG